MGKFYLTFRLNGVSGLRKNLKLNIMNDNVVLLCVIGAIYSVINSILLLVIINSVNHKREIKKLNHKLDLILKAENNTGS